ncbi:penicillin-binding protein 1B [Neptunomonas antarctica]|uniref:Penicillin-binding protein 1B n=1 Tax=Neptunomonas antarctica TaxID=619304 RepID=A0A1N7PLS1_9GAMM|nr:penicillin-binding protein 1B [Neptunomonas antarctica]SIT11538.1 penicillin-binding protein 1B [Neptunomonas antarctica]
MNKKRTPAKKTPRKRASAAKKKGGFWRTFRALLLKLTLLGIVIGGIGLMYLDAQIRQQFEGKRWALPAKVFARPLELYAGLPISIQDLKIELAGLGYQTVRHASLPGQAEFSSSKAHIFTRGFAFPDGREPAQQLQLDFNSDQLSRVRNAKGQTVNLVRLEPVLIGGIYPQNNEDRDLVRLEDVPTSLTQALIAIEDQSYYDHFGISFKGIARAMWINVRAGRFVQGGSTLTQQLIKNFYLTSDRTLARKLMELPMAVLLELHYSKDEILEAYLNEVYLGQEGSRAIHGMGLGGQYYFSQPIQELQLSQVALLAGLVKGPSYYDPRRHPERAKQRRDLVLRVMRDEGNITEELYQQTIQKPLGVVKQKSLLKGAYPAYLDLVKRQLRESYHEDDLRTEGLRVYTGLNPIVQAKAETALLTTVTGLEKRYGKRAANLEASMVVTDPQTGEVLSIIGGKSTRYEGFNRALDAIRPIGSLVKPAVYLTALDNGYSLVSPLKDEPISVAMPNGSTWEPQNFGKNSHGTVPLHQALAHSYNLATANLGMALGVGKVVDTLHKLGVTRDLDAYPSLLLGAQGLPAIEVATMYQTIAANGFQMPLRAIRMVTDNAGTELSRYPFQVKQTVSGESIHLLQYAMQEVAREGTARSVYTQLPSNLNVAGKTGTSNDQRDSWFAGFTGNRLAVVWLGRDDNTALPFTGSGGALKVWTAFMKEEKPEPFIAPVPEGVDYLWVDKETGYLSDERCQGAIPVPFIQGSKPQYRVDCGVEPVQNSETKSLDWFRRWFRQE